MNAESTPPPAASTAPPTPDATGGVTADRAGIVADPVGGTVADPVADTVAILARALFQHTLAAFKVVPELDRGPALAALDRFIAAPGPAAFLGAVRELREARRRVLIESNAAGTLRRALAGGIEALRRVRGVPAGIADRLATDLPLDALTGQRMFALVALARSYEELAGRVAADTEEMRRRYQAAPPRKRRPRR
jgi:hypothetical protein